MGHSCHDTDSEKLGGGVCCSVILCTANLAWRTGLELNVGFCVDRLVNNHLSCGTVLHHVLCLFAE